MERFSSTEALAGLCRKRESAATHNNSVRYVSADIIIKYLSQVKKRREQVPCASDLHAPRYELSRSGLAQIQRSCRGRLPGMMCNIEGTFMYGPVTEEEGLVRYWLSLFAVYLGTVGTDLDVP